MGIAQARRGSSEDTRYPESSDNSSAYTPDAPLPASLEDDAATADNAGRARPPGAAGGPAIAAASGHSSEDDDCILVGDAGALVGGEGAPAAPDERPWSVGDLRGGTLVVCPTSVLHQWRRELKDKVAQSTGALQA